MKKETAEKKVAERYHASKRLRERHNIEYTGTVRKTIRDIITGNRSLKTIKETNRLSHHYIIIRHSNVLHCLRCVYDRQRSEVVSFLPQDDTCTNLLNLNKSDKDQLWIGTRGAAEY